MSALSKDPCLLKEYELEVMRRFSHNFRVICTIEI